MITPKSTARAALFLIFFAALTAFCLSFVICHQNKIYVSILIIFLLTIFCHFLQQYQGLPGALSSVVYIISSSICLWHLGPNHVKILSVEGDFPLLPMYVMVCMGFAVDYPRKREALLEAAFIAAVSILYLVVQTDPIYRIPVSLVFVCFFGGRFTLKLRENVDDNQNDDDEPAENDI